MAFNGIRMVERRLRKEPKSSLDTQTLGGILGGIYKNVYSLRALNDPPFPSQSNLLKNKAISQSLLSPHPVI